jgi:hypothetical protein
MNPIASRVAHGVVASLVFLSVSSSGIRANAQAGYFAWNAIGHVAIKGTCANNSCGLVVHPPQRYRNVALSTDSTFPTVFAGNVTTTCTDGTQTQFLLRPSTGAGIFQMIQNTCVNFNMKDVTVQIDSVELSPEDASRGVVLAVYGAI